MQQSTDPYEKLDAAIEALAKLEKLTERLAERIVVDRGSGRASIDVGSDAKELFVDARTTTIAAKKLLADFDSESRKAPKNRYLKFFRLIRDNSRAILSAVANALSSSPIGLVVRAGKALDAFVDAINSTLNSVNYRVDLYNRIDEVKPFEPPRSVKVERHQFGLDRERPWFDRNRNDVARALRRSLGEDIKSSTKTKSLLFKRVLREVDITPDSLTQTLYKYFERYLNITQDLLPNNFIKSLVRKIVKNLLKFDEMFTNNQGFILIPNEGSKLRRGAEHFQIKAFIDTVIQTCSVIANRMLDIPSEKLRLFEKTFIQAFSDESSNRKWKVEFAKHLTNEIAASKPFYIKIQN